MLFSSLGVANIVKKDVATTKPNTTTGAFTEHATQWSRNPNTVLWDNGLPDGMNGLISGEFWGWHCEIIDDVQPSFDWTVGSAEFYFLSEYGPTDVTSINARVYADSGADSPTTTLLAYENSVDYTATWTGNMPWGYYELDCVVNFNGISLPAGSIYWFELQPVSANLDYWETSTGWGSPIYGAWPEAGYYQWVTSQTEFGADYNVNFQLSQALDHDVLVKSIDAPVDGTAYAPIYPTTTIQNGGVNDETVDVEMTIQSTSAGGTLFNQDFTGCTTLPDGWTTNLATNWIIDNYNNAGGVAPELEFDWTPSNTGTWYCMTPVIDTTGVTQATFSFKQMVNDYNGDYTLAVETTTDGGATWNTVWTIPGQWMDAQTTTIPLDTTSGLGSATFQIAFVYIGNSFNINWWYIDDVNLALPAGIITEVDQTQTINIASGETQVLTYDAWTPAAWHNVDGGNVQYTVTVSAPLADDGAPGNNVMTKTPTLWFPYFADVAMDAYLSPVGGMGGVYAPQAQISNYGQFDQTFNAQVQIGSPYNIDYYFNDFESDNGGLYTPGTLWQYGSGGSGYAPYPYSGSYMWGTNAANGGGYPCNANEHLYSPAFTVPANAKMDIMQWFYSEMSWDGMNVQISTDGGATWALLGSYGAPYTYSSVVGLGGEPGFSGYNNYWAPYTFDLGPYAGQNVMLDFWFGSDSSVTYYGNFFDDVHIYSVGVAPEYDQTISVSVPAGQTQIVSFPAWTPAAYETVDNTWVSYIAGGTTLLAGDENTLNDACANVPFSLWFPYRWDVAPTSIISPWDNIPATTLPVQFTIANLGSHPCDDFPVYCTITGPNGVEFSASSTVSLAFQESQTIDYGTWTPDELSNGAQGWIQYTMTVSTAYPGDINTANDVMTHVFYLFYPYVQDVGVVSLNSPVGDGVGAPKAVDVTVGAFGVSNPPAFNTEVQIGQPYVIGTLYSQDFTGCTTLPDGWGTDYPSNWYIDTYGSYAGGSAPELIMNWYPDQAGPNTRCWSGEIDTSGSGAGMLSFNFATNNFDSNYNLAVETSTDGVTWHQVWTVPGGAYSAQTVQVPLSGADGFGSPTFRVAFDFLGDTFDINYWYVDNIVITSMGVTPEYDQTIYGTTLLVGQTTDLSFPTWTPQAYTMDLNGDIQYLCLAHTICAGDYDTGNDVAGSLFTLHYANDVQVKSITDPHTFSNGRAGSTYYMQPGTIPVAGIVKNVGTYDESGMTASATIGSVYSESIPGISLAIGEEQPISFPDATLNTEGTYTLTMSLPLGTDANPGDNTKTLTIGVDATPPVSSYTLSPTSPNGNAGWYVTSVKVTLSSTDAMSGVKEIKYKIDDGAWTTYNKAFWVNASGKHMIYYKATDKVGNEESEKSFSLWVDKEVPTIVLSKQILLNKIKFTATVNDTVSGVDRVEFYLVDPYGNSTLIFNDTDGSDGYSCTLHPIPQGGNYSLFAYVYDIAGNSAFTNSTSQPAPGEQQYGGAQEHFVQQSYSMKP